MPEFHLRAPAPLLMVVFHVVGKPQRENRFERAEGTGRINCTHVESHEGESWTGLTRGFAAKMFMLD